MVTKTGWPPGLLQDDCRALSKWFAGRLGARQQIKDRTMNTKEVLKAIDDALGKYEGDELELMQALESLADGWKMRRQELEDDAE